MVYMPQSMISTAIPHSRRTLNKWHPSVTHSTNCTLLVHWILVAFVDNGRNTVKSLYFQQPSSQHLSPLSWKPHQGASTADESKWPYSQRDETKRVRITATWGSFFCIRSMWILFSLYLWGWGLKPRSPTCSSHASSLSHNPREFVWRVQMLYPGHGKC